jgi:small subunit ribosomal protein S15
MARMHSRKHGRHGSKKPLKRIRQEWLIYDRNEVEKLIIKMAKEGRTSSQIGIILRDLYGVPDSRVFGLRVRRVIEAQTKKEVPEDLYNLMKKAVQLHKHMAENKKDSKAKHGLELLESKIRRLTKYYRNKGRLPQDWTYTIDRAKLIVG